MRRVIIGFYAAVVAVLAAITFTAGGGEALVGQWWFVAMWLLRGVMLVWCVTATRMWRHMPRLLLHVSLLLMLAGGAATWLLRDEKRLTLAPRVPVDAGLHAPLCLDSFVVETYPGGLAPRDYVSYLTLGQSRHFTVSVNNPAQVDGYTIRQEACDSLGRSTLELAKDPLGIPLTYGGYILFTVSGIMLLADPRGRFRRLLAATAVAIMPAVLFGASLPGVSSSQADSMERRQVMWKGRAAPMGVAASQLCRKLSGTRSPGGASSVQVVASMVLYPREWNTRRLLKIGDSRLADSLGLVGGYASMSDLISPDGSYRLRSLYGIDPALDKAVLALDERVGLVTELQQGRLIRPVPDHIPPLPVWRSEADLVGEQVPFSQVFFPAALITGLVAITGRLRRSVRVVAWLLAAWQAAGWCLTWVADAVVPLGSGGETMRFLSVAVMIVTLICFRREPILTGVGIMAAAFAGLVAWLDLRDPVLTPLMPVLHSPWLSVHVSVVMTAYALLTLASLSSLVGLTSAKMSVRMCRVSQLLLYPAMLLLGVGIFTGAVWAQTSWGRYWAWDPKETWALITFMIYAVPLHRAARMTPRRHNLYTSLALLTLLMTYFGVNYLPSLHAYQ